MSKFLVLALTVFSMGLTACGKESKKEEPPPNRARTLNKAAFPNIPQSIRGQWRLPEETDKGTVFRQTMYVNENLVGIEVVCEQGLESVAASFAVSARVNEDSIEVLEPGSVSITGGRMTCTASIKPGKFYYTVQGNAATLWDANKGQMNITRIF